MDIQQKIKEQTELLYKSKSFEAGVEIVSKSWQDYMRYVLSCVSIDGHWLEFGCYAGGSIKFIEKEAPPIVDFIYGFDSFEGLQEEWNGLKKGSFNRKGQIPQLNSKRIKFVKGYFNQTLPNFAQEMQKPAAFIHVDSDLYSSCTTIFSCLKGKIINNTIIAFDEIHNWEDCLNGEMRALIESELKYEWIAHTKYTQAAVRII